MDKQALEVLICSNTTLIVEAMKKIDLNSSGLLYVTDENNRLAGCISDGDIRRWIIKGGALNAQVGSAMNTTPVAINKNARNDAIGIMQEKQITSIAVIDDRGHIEDIIFLMPKSSEIRKSFSLKGTPVVVMAGGKGTRLNPFTRILPKPLIPVGDIPILERILDRFFGYGADQFYLTINYKKEMIKAYFAEVSRKYDICFVEEEIPLGTAGSIRLIKEKFSEPIIVTNCDVLIDTDYGEVLKYHKDVSNDLTIVSSLKNTKIPYGVLHAKEKGIITSMEEKPEISNFINTGMYVLNPEFVDWIPENQMFHMTDLAENMMKNDKRVGMYPISENSFLDMGELAELKRMEERINGGFIR